MRQQFIKLAWGIIAVDSKVLQGRAGSFICLFFISRPQSTSTDSPHLSWYQNNALWYIVSSTELTQGKGKKVVGELVRNEEWTQRDSDNERGSPWAAATKTTFLVILIGWFRMSLSVRGGGISAVYHWISFGHYCQKHISNQPLPNANGSKFEMHL